MSRILFVASLLLLGAGILSSNPLNATTHSGDVISSPEETLDEAANNSSEGATVKSTGILSSNPLNATTHPGDVISSPEEMLTEAANNGDVQTTKGATVQPTGRPAVTVKPGRCPIVGFLVHISHILPHDRYPPLGPLSKARFKLGFSSSSSEEYGSDSREGFGRYYHSYRHHGLRQRPNPCRAPDCVIDGDCLGELKCCAIPGCGRKCLRPVPSDQLPGDMKRFQP